jgi:hypothetical protein
MRNIKKIWLPVDYEESISETIKNASTVSKEILSGVENASENGSIAWYKCDRMMKSEDAECFFYIESYLDSIERSDILVVVNF